MDNRKAVVIDNGTGFLKAGFAGAQEPSVIFPAVVGKKKPNCRRASLLDHYSGEDAMNHRSNVTIRHPVEKGVVNQWAEMEMLWDHAYHRLRTKAMQQPLLVTECVQNPDENRKRTVETLLETYKVPALIVADTPSLCMYAEGETTGLVLESGYSATYAVPIIKGEVMHEAVTRLDLGGNDLTVFLLRLVESRGYFFPPAKREMFAEVKERLCYVAMDYAMEELAVTKFAGFPQSSGIKQSYNLAGDTISLETERFHCPESLFQPDWLRVDAVGVHHLIYNAIDKCPRDTHDELYRNILVTGGGARFPGFRERLQAEVTKLCHEDTAINIRLPEYNKTLAWRGGSEFASSSESDSKWITLKEYQEIGADIIEKKRGILSRAGQTEAEATPDRDVQDAQAEHDHHAVVGSSSLNMYHNRKVLHSAATTPGMFGSSATPLSGFYKSGASTPGGFRGGKLYKGINTPDSTGISSVGPSRVRDFLANSVLSVHKIVDETRPLSPEVYDKPSVPTLNKTPEQGAEAEAEDEVAPLKSSAKTRESTLSGSAGCRSAGSAGFRKLSLFDHLLDEVTTFGYEVGGQALPEDDVDDDDASWASRISYDSTLISKMMNDELLPGRGRSGLRRDETININEFKKQASAGKVFGDGGLALGGKSNTIHVHDFSVIGMPKLPPISMPIPDIQITTCPTPHGSASPKREMEAVNQPVEYTPKQIKFKFKG